MYPPTEKILEKKEPEVFEIPEIPEDQVELEKGYFCCVNVMLWFKKYVCVDRKEEQGDMEGDHNDEDTENLNLDY